MIIVPSALPVERETAVRELVARTPDRAAAAALLELLALHRALQEEMDRRDEDLGEALSFCVRKWTRAAAGHGDC